MEENENENKKSKLKGRMLDSHAILITVICCIAVACIPLWYGGISNKTDTYDTSLMNEWYVLDDWTFNNTNNAESLKCDEFNIFATDLIYKFNEDNTFECYNEKTKELFLTGKYYTQSNKTLKSNIIILQLKYYGNKGNISSNELKYSYYYEVLDGYDGVPDDVVFFRKPSDTLILTDRVTGKQLYLSEKYW